MAYVFKPYLMYTVGIVLYIEKSRAIWVGRIYTTFSNIIQHRTTGVEERIQIVQLIENLRVERLRDLNKRDEEMARFRELHRIL